MKLKGIFVHSIEQKSIETFQINLKYLSENQPKVYTKIAILGQAIADGSYIEKYALEYKDEYFDILELSSNQYLYNKNSITHANNLAKNINYKKSDAVIEGFYNVQISDAQLEIHDGKILNYDQWFAEAKIIHYNASVTSKNDEMKEIFKFIFCGVGLGFHLKEIQNKIHSSILFIMEDNLEVFRLSLFTTNYQQLSKQALLFFSIMDNDKEFASIFGEFLTQGYTHNHYIKYSILTQDDIKKVKRIQDSIVKSRHLIRPYQKELKELLKAPEYLVEHYPFIDISKNYSTISPLSDKPVLLIASGPSLNKNSKWLQDNKDKFIIIAVLSSVLTLHALGVKPDIVTNIDSDTIYVKMLSTIDIKDFFNKTVFIFSSVVAKNLVNALPKEQLYFFETASGYKKGSRIIATPSVGETTYGLSLILGVKKLYLLGLDLALNPQTKNTHSPEHIFSRVLDGTTEQNEQYTSLHDTFFYVKGNFLDKVPTTALYHLSINGFANMSKHYLTNNQIVYNLNNGALLEGATPLPIEEINTTEFSLFDKEKYFKQTKLFLDGISENNLNKHDIENFDRQIEEATRLLELVKSYKQSVSTSDFATYIKEFYALYIELLNLKNETKYDINNVFALYLQRIISYIFDIFNTKNLKNEKEHIKNINEIYIRQLIKILDLYLITMKIYREWAEK